MHIADKQAGTMKTLLFGTLLATTILIATESVKAHDPSEHADAREMPDCTTMPDLDDVGMDRSDPVAQALRKQCMSSLHHENTTIAKPEIEEPETDEPLPDNGRSHNHHGE